VLQEGAIIYCGLSYNKADNNNVVQWDACTNIRVRQLETGCTLENYVTTFNCNTNLWMARYAELFSPSFFKRTVKPVGRGHLSRAQFG
jgi:hypothetical protein